MDFIEKLNNIYKTQKVEIQNVENNKTNTKEKNNFIYFIIILFMILIISIIIFKVKQKTSK